MSSANRSLHTVFTKFQRTTKPKAKATVAANSTARKAPKSTAAAEGETQLRKVATKFIKSCEKQRFRHDKATYVLTVRRLAAAKKFSMIEEVLEHQKKYDDVRFEGFAARLIFLYGQAGMFDHARKLFDELPQLNCPRGIMSFNSLLKAGLDSNNFHVVVEAFKALPPEVSIEPDLISHNILVHALCKLGDFDRAISTLREMEKNIGKEPDLFTFNTLLNALYGTAGRFSEGETVFAMMATMNVVPDVITYNARLRGVFGENGIELTPDELVVEMESKGIRPNLFSYNALIKGYCERGDLKGAMIWYGELRKSECSPNLSTYAVLIPGCCDAGDFDSAFEVCLEAIEGRLLLKAGLFRRVVDGLVFEEKTEEASKLVELINSTKYLNYNI